MNVIQGNGFVAEIVRSSRRKTAAIKIKKGKVFVVVPECLTMAAIESLVDKKHRWIKEKLAIQNEIMDIKPKEFISGESFSYLGKNHPLKIESGLYPVIKLHQDELVVSVRDKTVDNSQAIKQLLFKWYKQQAESELRDKTERYSSIIGVNPSSVTIKSFKSRWGSCSIAGGIQYNWKIIIAPDRIVNYVVIHELCHILHHNHSPAFWKAVEKYCHDYRDCSAWLKINGGRLEI
ncbi:MAG: M48 family metallopeptidase [Methylococcaceae bacterium]|nr:M48 family metallopeptidase [Methylococcaceae bacterium]MDD1642296.1 M48 family metallopeptidase [Methylococcaceae bacterium]